MTKMIQNGSISYSQIKSDINTYLTNLSNWNEIKNSVTSSNLSLLVDLMAGFGSYLVYNNYQLRNETYLSSAKLSSSVYAIARTFGYLINRYTAPAISVRYMGIPTVTITRGQILGTYGDYDIIYWGEPKTIEKLDEFDVVIGKYVELEKIASYDEGILKFDLQPTILESIDNSMVKIIYNNASLEFTRNIEEYVVSNTIIDYSNDPYSTTMMVADTNFDYGYTGIDPGATVVFDFIETDGKMENIDLEACDFSKFDNLLTPVSVSGLGTSGETLEDIRRLVPLYYSAQRRMVTQSDYKYIAEANTYIKSAHADRDNGTIQVSYLTVSDTISQGDNVKFTINAKRYDWDIEAETVDDAVNEIAYKLKGDPIVQVDSVDLENRRINISAKSSRFQDLWTIYTDNITRTITTEGVSPLCCTVQLYYVKYNTVDDPIPLTYYEQREVADYLKKYKMVGTRIILIPASRIKADINIDVSLTDHVYKDRVTEAINKIISNYELKLSTEFNFVKFLTEVSQIELEDSETNSLVTPVTSVYPNDLVWKSSGLAGSEIEGLNIPADDTRYIKFNSVTINYVK